MVSRFPVAAVVAVVVAGWPAAGCEGRYANLGEPSRPEPSLDTESTATWIGDDGAFVWLLIAGQEDVDGRAGAIIARISRDTSTVIEAGSYVADPEAGRLTLQGEVRLTRDAGLDQSFVGRPGADAETLVPPLERSFELDLDPDDPTYIGLRSAELGLDVRLVDFGRAFAGLDPENAGAVPELFRMAMLPVLSMQARIPFFGSRQVTALVSEGPFDTAGLIEGSFRTTVVDVVAPSVEISADGLVDLTGLIFDGRYGQLTNLSGDGDLDGRFGFRLEGSGEELLTGRISFADVEVVRGVPARGTYGFDVEGSAWEVDASLLLDFDLSAALLPSETDP